ncbi:MAG: glycosyltransferase [Leptolyngbya sp. PLA1]|nr:glycosyltransferase [Leptolyngbya sp. PLA1]
MTSDNDSLTYVIAARDAAATIAQTLRSLVCQTRPDWRCVVIDDGSTDRTATAALEVQDPRIRVEVRPPRGVAHARNTGFAMCATPFVCFLDADDAVAPQHAACMLASIGAAAVVACGFRYTDPMLNDTGWEHTPTDGDATLDGLCEMNQFALGGLIFRRGALRGLCERARTGELALFSTRTHHEDWELLLRLTAAGAAWAPVVREALYSYRLLPASRTTDLRPLWKDGLELIQRFHPSARGGDDASRRWSLRSLARAAVAGREALCTEILAMVGPLAPADADVLAGAIRWSVRRLQTSRDPAAAGEFLGWRGAVARRLGASPVAIEAAQRGFDSSRDWSSIALRSVGLVKPGQTLVIYGMGRNGREVLRALPRDRVPLAFVDDRHGVECDLPRVAPADLGPQHVVLVTPDARSHILAVLARTRAGSVLLPERVVAAAAA